MATSELLGLIEEHESSVVEYLRFARYKREQRLATVDGAFEDVRDVTVHEDNLYRSDEVNKIIDDLKSGVHHDLEAELADNDHTHVLLMSQLFKKAQEWKLVLKPKIDELESMKDLADVRAFEESSFAGPGGAKMKSPGKSKLDPLADDGPAAVLKAEIRFLDEENKALKKELKDIKSQASSATKEVDTMASTLTNTKDALAKATASSKVTDAEVEALQQEVSAAKGEISQLKSSTKSAVDKAAYQATEDKLAASLHELLAVQADLDTARKDLEKKFSESNAYNNLKKILVTKNDQIKQLRSKLSKYEGDQ